MSKPSAGTRIFIVAAITATIVSTPLESAAQRPDRQFVKSLPGVTNPSSAEARDTIRSDATALAQIARDDAFTALTTTARRDGHVNVIVQVDVGNIDQLGAVSASARAPQFAARADAQLAGAIDLGVGRELAKLAGVDHTVGHRYRSIPFVSMRVSEAALARLEASPGVIAIQEDLLAHPTLNNTVNITGASTAWTSGLDGAGWTVAILDTGILSAHEFFSTKPVLQACFAQGSNGPGGGGDCPNGAEVDLSPGSAEPYPSSWQGFDHGTHVAGIAAGEGPSVPASGIARGAEIMAVKVFSQFAGACSGADCLLSATSDQIAAMDHIYSIRTTRNFAALNLSLGGGAFSNQATCDSSNAAQKSAIDRLRSVGIATVIATGNDASCTSISSPGCISSAIAVGATTDGDTEYGGNNWHPLLADIFAPGVNVLSSVASSTTAYAGFTGTSMATPHVTGAIAILRQFDPNATVTQLLSALQQTGQTISGKCGQSVPQRRIQIDDALTLLGFDACCQGGGVCTDTSQEDCALLGGKFRPGHKCGELPSPCDEDVKFSQTPGDDGESLPSNIDWTDLAPNEVVADDFTSDGRPVRSLRWWGAELGPSLDEYAIDDGTQDNSIGLTGGGDVIWLNQFNVLPGLETITTVSVAWGNVPNGTAATILIYDDPNDDGDPTDAVLLTSFATTIANANTDTLNLIDVPDTNVGSAGDGFFVGAYVTGGPGQFPAALDEASSAGRSWVAGDDAGLGNINDLSLNDLPPSTLVDVGLPGNWMVRADAGPPPIDSTPDGWFVSFHEPVSEFGAPAPPLGLYYCDVSVVTETPTLTASCDGKSVNEYRADLADCCLVHATPDSRSGAVPAAEDGFLEERCVDYALDVQGVIGHRFDDVEGVCTEVPTGRTVDGIFWGWHTAPPSGGAFGLTSGASSVVTMSGSDWLYGPWGPPSTTCAAPDMAFELLTDEILDGDPDANGDGYPDSCECTSITGAVADPSGILENRYLPFTVLPPSGVGSRQAIQIELVDVPLYAGFNGQTRWVGPPSEFPDPDAGDPTRAFVAAGLSCTPHFADWSTLDLLQVYGAELIPDSEYAVRIFDDCCNDFDDPSCFSAPLTVLTGRFGDVISPFWMAPGDVQPNFTDIAALVSKFLGDVGSLSKARTQLQPNVVFPENAVDFRDISAGVAGFLGTPYDATSFAVGPCVCPSSVTCGVTACVSSASCGGGLCVGGFCADECGRCAP